MYELSTNILYFQAYDNFQSLIVYMWPEDITCLWLDDLAQAAIHSMA